MFSACGSGGSSGSNVSQSLVPTADFFKLAIVPNQTVSTSTFEVQIIAELLNPNAGSLAAPSILDNGGTAHTMTAKILQWPGTVENSITVWSATVPLVSDQVNNLTAVSGTKTIPFSIKHKSALNILTATNSTQLINYVKSAITDPTIDGIQVTYNETNLGGILANVGSGITNARSYWMTVEPATGYTLTWNRDTGATLGRPFVDWMHLKGVVFGSDTSDEAAGQYYIEVNHHVWLSNSEFRGKYKYTWLKDTPITAATVDDIRTNLNEGQQVYLTDCLWDGTAEIATSYVQLARDLRFNSHRWDINNFGKVLLNMYAQDIETVRNSTNTDYLHNDGFQIWGGVQTSDIVFKGLKIVSPHVPSDIQPFLFDSTFTPNYQNVLLDTLTIVGAAPGTVLTAQAAGHLTNSRISNLSFPNQHIALRYDFTALPNGAFLPTNVFMSNFDIKDVEYIAAAGHTSVTYNYTNVASPSNISPELTANVDLIGTTFTNIKVSAVP